MDFTFAGQINLFHRRLQFIQKLRIGRAKAFCFHKGKIPEELQEEKGFIIFYVQQKLHDMLNFDKDSRPELQLKMSAVFLRLFPISPITSEWSLRTPKYNRESVLGSICSVAGTTKEGFAVSKAFLNRQVRAEKFLPVRLIHWLAIRLGRMAYALTPHLLPSLRSAPLVRPRISVINPFYAIDPELFDFHLFRFSFGETTEEVTKNRKSKS